MRAPRLYLLNNIKRLTTKMSLEISTESPSAIETFLTSNNSKPRFLVVYASPRPADGLMWCGDCRRAEPLITKRFSGRTDDVKVVYAGSQVEYVFVNHE
jgi:hypothetical protein